MFFCFFKSKVLFGQLKEGNSYFQQRLYSEALDKYCQALDHCRQHNMKEQMALVRVKCAMACLKLQMYSDAYTHCTECVKLDPENHKVRAMTVHILHCGVTTGSHVILNL